MTRLSRRTLIAAGGIAPAAAAGIARAAPRKGAPLAPTPPMGWNSWNSFATTITEAQALETATIQRDRLLPAGYSIFTIDIQWYEPGATGYEYRADAVPVLDGHGRLQPDPKRFPSAADGRGFRSIADRVHAMGLKFGIHLMRGIPREAVRRNLPILGTRYRAQDIADPTSICSWNSDMVGVDMRRPGAQAYYDSVFAQYADWGVDLVKMDDMSRPYDSHAPEIEAAAAAIRRSGRAILLSLSPGETPLSSADHVRAHAQMWRISDDFWDEWALLDAQFTRLENWQRYAGPGGWPDADMLPLGRLALGQRDTKFTAPEQRTLMTLWSIARSPLIMGGDLRHLDAATLALLTNPEVIAVNQASSRNRPLHVQDGMRAWEARAANGDTYLALFNPTPKAARIGIDPRWLNLAGRLRVRDLWARADLPPVTGRIEADLPSHGAALYRLAAA
ncbi:alpha-galactosidase [Sphingomonas sp. Leaf407]|uniref:glycoside hydrolase family 27 protein n=1 Tax=unclassified Sphingomonas TaxID=196159 RepID=UPI0006F6A90F|nr:MULTISPECIES: glycoside hydrolase family 27 protein [unclassified Sphingomonas]KQN36919.1 alpha-galactosidase [Sphingomonas sp. Leaf42]KQT30346.1 alpha-galactosidase [Sphingomonas sp. Leaf407]